MRGGINMIISISNNTQITIKLQVIIKKRLWFLRKVLEENFMKVLKSETCKLKKEITVKRK